MVLGGVGLTLVLGLALGLGLAATITRPLRRLSENVQRIADGDYRARAPVRGHDEVDTVARNLNRMAERLEEAELSRQRQLAAIVHELARPLTGMRAAVDTLRDGAGTVAEERSALLEGVAEELSRLSRLVDTLQQMQKRTLRPLELNRTYVPLDRLLRATVANYQSLAALSDINLILELPPGNTLVWVDVDRLIQVLTNLLDNALKFAPRGGRIAVRAYDDYSDIWVSVTDSGTGIAPDELPFVFQEFFRGGNGHAPEKNGMGLGLAICRDIITGHGGTIQAFSPIGGGTCIQFSIPKSPVHVTSRENVTSDT
jgi:two-component system sensor histidine kinase BaeS